MSTHDYMDIQLRPDQRLARVPHTYIFPAIIDEWHDGDTVICHRGAAPGLVIHGEHVRVEGINAPELHSEGGVAARDYATQIAPPETEVLLYATRQDKYGRFLARVSLPDGRDFSTVMIQSGHAIAYLL